MSEVMLLAIVAAVLLAVVFGNIWLCLWGIKIALQAVSDHAYRIAELERRLAQFEDTDIDAEGGE